MCKNDIAECFSTVVSDNNTVFTIRAHGARAQGLFSQGGPEGHTIFLTHLFSKHFCRTHYFFSQISNPIRRYYTRTKAYTLYTDTVGIYYAIISMSAAIPTVQIDNISERILPNLLRTPSSDHSRNHSDSKVKLHRLNKA